MKKLNKHLFILLVILTSALAANAGKPPGGNTPDIPVTTDIIDTDGGIPYNVRSDAMGPYLHAVDGVVSVLMANGLNRIAHGDWQLALTESPRTATFTLDEANDVESGENGYILDATLLGNLTGHARFLMQCTRSMQSMLIMHQGDAIVCPLLVHFSDNPYRLNMKFTVDWPETEKVQVYCATEDSGGCNDWLITPIPGINGGRTRARLEEFVTTRGKQGEWKNRGAFLLNFRIRITRP